MEKKIENILYMEVRTIFMGSPQFAVPILRSLLHSPYHVVAVYTQPDKPVGRSRRIALPPVKRLAMEHGVPVIQPETFRSVAVVQELASFKPELIVVAAFGRILPQEVLALPKFGCLNVHPSLLPKHRGPSPVAASLLCGDQPSGVTIMLMDGGIDSGPILAQQKAGISSADTTDSLASKLASIGAELLMKTLPEWLEAKLKPQPQDEAEATYSKLMTSEDGEIDWHLSAVELWLQARAYNPWPGCYTWWKGKRLKIPTAIPLGDVAQGEVGEVVVLPEPPEVGVITGRGILGLRQVQLEGKREVSVDDFVRGRRDFIGSILGRR